MQTKTTGILQIYQCKNPHLSQLVEDILVEHGEFGFETLGGDHEFLCILKYTAPPVGDK
jgi:hypothetical protein